MLCGIVFLVPSNQMGALIERTHYLSAYASFLLRFPSSSLLNLQITAYHHGLIL
jgi:hypothetical protein